jgi:hypothetical protein
MTTTKNTSRTMDAALDHLRTMRKQEETSYRIAPENLASLVLRLRTPRPDRKKTPSESQREACADKDVGDFSKWRSQMVLWSYRIAKTCRMQKETVEIAMWMMDRFVTMKSDLLINGRIQFQLGSMTALYTASKIHETSCMTSLMVEQLSGGLYTQQQIEEMELKLLLACEWKVNPPTATSFARYILDIIPAPLIPDRTAVLELTAAQIELFLMSGSIDSFSIQKASSLASAALLNSLQSILHHGNLAYFRYLFANVLDMDITKFESGLKELQDHLLGLVIGGSPRSSDDDKEHQETLDETADKIEKIEPSTTMNKNRRISISSYKSSPSSVTVTTGE